ncbi:universal stress protein [Mycolicibacterium sp. 050158]|uniref:universal stress protein n=1 Tax=Mycolicibacterium sp. 050158 TaxID=3090602 RepID=UPI00299DA42D|nr:universal stress protein [Mycolicibacterium sp. 050158]MDX1890811.1 universal stress protein [Mycolicibacterium sp. 050158]
MSSLDGRGVIVAVDGSPSSLVATDWAARDAALRHVPLRLVHVLAEPAVGMWPEPASFGDFSAWREENGHQILSEARRVADQAIAEHGPVRIEEVSIAGTTVPSLVDLSKDATLMVVGCRGQGALKRRLLGSVSSGLVHHAHCPVAVIHDQDPLMDHPASAPVLVGIDGSPASELATAVAFDEASRRGVGLIAMHSWASDDVYLWANVDWDVQLEIGKEALAERLAGWQEHHPEVPVDHRLVYGAPAEKLLEASEEAQLTVVGSHGRGGFAGMLLGSVSSAVAQGARMPVIVARQG